MNKNLKTTPLNRWHVKGNDSFELLNYCFTREIKDLKKGQCIYGAFLDINGHCLDDAIIYKFNTNFFMICINAGMGSAIAHHLDLNKTDNCDVIIEDLSGKIAKMDIQGKNSARILGKLIKHPDVILKKMPYFSFKGHFDKSHFENSGSEKFNVQLLDGTPILLSRSGYTGEFGFEIFIRSDAIVKLWEEILKAGEQFDITACGLAARDSLRTGAGLPLSHQDIGSWTFVNHPWEFALAYNHDKTGFTKKFLGVTCVTDMGITWHSGKIVSINSQNLPEDLKIKGLSCGFVMVNEKFDISSNNHISLTLKEKKRAIKVKIVKDIRPDRTARINFEF